MHSKTVRTNRLWAVIVCGLAICLFLGIRTSARETCNVPRYRVGKTFEDTPSNTMIGISVSLPDFAPSRLVCLADALKRRYSNRNSISVFIFSEPSAAQHFIFPGVEKSPRIGKWAAQMHAAYFYDVSKGEDS